MLRMVSYPHRPKSGHITCYLNRTYHVPTTSGGFGYGLYEGSRVLQNGVINTEIHRNVAPAQFGGGIDVRTRLKLLFPIGLRGEVRDYYTLKTPRFRVPIQRREQHNVVVSAGWPFTFRRLRREGR